MKITIPSNTIPKQGNQGEIFGDIWSSWNLDLASNAGKVRVSPRPIVHTTSLNNALMVSPIAFVRNMADTGSTDTYFAVCSQKIFKLAVTNLGSTMFGADSLTNSPTTALSNLYSDAVNFNGSLIVSLKTTLAKLTAGTWTANWYGSLAGSPSLTDSTPHPMCVGFDKGLLIGNGNVLAYVDLDMTTVNPAKLTLDSRFEVQWIRSSNSQYWIGCRNKFGGEGKVFSWDGQSEYVVGDYGIKSDITFSGVIKDEICYTVNNLGQLLAFGGGGFIEIDRFPIANSKTDKFNDGLNTYGMNINRNGMAVINGNVNILVSSGLNSTNYTFIENQLSGLWEYTKETGLHHKNSVSKNTDDTNVNDYGSPLLVRAGALFPLAKDSSFLLGADLWRDDGLTPISVINFLAGDSKNKMGYYITPKIYTNDIEEMWQAIHVLYKQLTTSGHFVHIKYRTSVNYRGSFDQPATWTSTTGFTCNATEFLAGVSAGDEVEILSGEGSGLSATITNLSSSAATIDQTLTGASGTFAFRVSNWTKLDTITDLISQNKSISIGANTNWIQFKILMYGAGDSPEIEKLIIKSENHLKS